MQSFRTLQQQKINIVLTQFEATSDFTAYVTRLTWSKLYIDSNLSKLKFWIPNDLYFYVCLKVQKNWVVVCVHVKRFSNFKVLTSTPNIICIKGFYSRCVRKQPPIYKTCCYCYCAALAHLALSTADKQKTINWILTLSSMTHGEELFGSLAAKYSVSLLVHSSSLPQCI